MPPGPNATVSPGNIIKKAFVRAMACMDDSSSLSGLSDIRLGTSVSSSSMYVTAPTATATTATMAIKQALSSPGFATKNAEQSSKFEVHSTCDPDDANLEPPVKTSESGVVVEVATSSLQTRIGSPCVFELENANLEPPVSLSVPEVSCSGTMATPSKDGTDGNETTAVMAVPSPAAFVVISRRNDATPDHKKSTRNPKRLKEMIVRYEHRRETLLSVVWVVE